MTTTTEKRAIRLRDLHKRFGAGETVVTALDHVSYDFPAGSFTAVMGPSGSGKSTLLHCAAGLDRPTSGAVLLGEDRLDEMSETELTLLRRRRIGFVFQEYNLLPSLTAAYNVALPLILARRRPPPPLVLAALAAVGLADRAGHLPHEMSRGQQQRAAIARALITRPEIVFADEPTGALDTNAARTVLRLLRSLADEHGQTIVMVTHDPVAASYADRVAFLADGRIADELTAPTPQVVAEWMAGAGR